MGSTPVVGGMNIVLSGDAATFSQAIDQAQKRLDQLKGKTSDFGKAASGHFDAAGAGAGRFGHVTVTSVQAASGALRELNGDFTNNIRAVERFITTIPGVGNALKAAFPLVGGLAFGAMLAEQVVRVSAFVKQLNQAPKEIALSFSALALQQHTATDELTVSTDKMQAFVDKIERKPINNAKIAIDEARLATDHFAASVTSANAKITELLEKHRVSSIGLLFGKPGTADREGTAKAFAQQADNNAYDLANAAPGSPEEARAKAALKATQDAQLAEARSDLAKRQAGAAQDDGLPDEANQNIDKGIITSILNQRKQQDAEALNAQTESAKMKIEAAKKLADEGAAAQRKADEVRLHAMEGSLNQEKLLGNVSVKAVYDYWDARRSAFRVGSEAYNQVVAKQTEAAVESARTAAATIKRFKEETRRQTGEDANELPRLLARNTEQMRKGSVKDAGEVDEGMISSNRLAIERASNDAREREAEVTDKAGRSITEYAAALQLAGIHAAEFRTTMSALRGELDIRQRAMDVDPSKENQGKVTAAQEAIDKANSDHTRQMQADADAIYGRQSSAMVGASDALREFVLSTQDAAAEMKRFTADGLRGFNDAVMKVLTGHSGRGGAGRVFQDFGSQLFASGSSSLLNHGEGSILKMLGAGTGDGHGPANFFAKHGGGFGGLLASLLGGSAASRLAGSQATASGAGSIDTIGSALTSLIPGFALGTPDFGGGMAMVGELGPELVNLPPHSSVTPNNKLGSVGGGSPTFDFRGANFSNTNQAQIEATMRNMGTHIFKKSVESALTAVAEKQRRSVQR